MNTLEQDTMSIFTRREIEVFRDQLISAIACNASKTSADMRLLRAANNHNRQSDYLLESIMIGSATVFIAAENEDLVPVARGCMTPSRNMLLRGMRYASSELSANPAVRRSLASFAKNVTRLN
jgi:hypothetical protein